MRVSAWLRAEQVRQLDELTWEWGFRDRAHAVEVAVRFLAKHSPRLDRLDV